MRLDFFIELKRRHVYRVAIAYSVVGWLLIEFCTQVFPVLHMPEWTQQLVVLAILFGFPLTLLLAWAFELTPDGVRRTEPAHSPRARTYEQHRRVGRMLDFVVIGILTLALVIALWRPWLHSHASATSPAKAAAMDTGSAPNPMHRYSIAVLPFTNNGKDTDQRYFSDGLSESLINALTQYPALTVIARASSFKLRHTSLYPQEIGKRLGVAYLLEGSVSYAGNVVRVQAELVDTADGHTVWSNYYDDQPDENTFAVQDAIVAHVVNALEVQLLRPTKTGAYRQTDRPPSGSFEAYNAFLRGNFYFNQKTEASWPKAIDAYQRAINADPNYAAAYAMLSAVWSNLAGAFDLGQGRENAFDRARSAAEKAVTLNGNLAMAYTTRGYVRETMLHLKDAMADYQHALTLDPSSQYARQGVATMQAAYGDTESAVRLTRELIRRDPLQRDPYLLLSMFLAQTGKYDASLDALERAISLQPTNPMRARLAELQLLRGDAGEAVKVGKSVSRYELRLWILALASPAAGDHAGGDRALHGLIDQYSDVVAYQIAQVYAFRGDADQTFHWLDRAWRQRDSGLATLLYDPIFKPYYPDPRFAEICHKLGVPVPASES